MVEMQPVLSYQIDKGLLRGMAFPGPTVVKNPPANEKDAGSIPGSEDPMEEEMAIYSIILAWKIPWTEEPGGLQSMGVTKKLDMTEHEHTAWYPFSPAVT